MTSGIASSIIEKVKPQWLATDDELNSYEVDGMVPTAGVRPPSVGAMSEVVGVAHEEGLATVPVGGGTQRSLGNPPRGYDLALDTRGLDCLIQYEPADLTVTVEAGMTMGKLGEILAAEGQFLPLEVPSPGKATVGGMLAAACFGPLGLTYGFPRDWLIGVKVVNADGRVTKGGGRVVKNVTGYDINKLYTGSLGTLGVIVEASLKVAPKPVASATLTAGFADLGAAMNGAWSMLDGYGGPSALTLLNDDAAEGLGLESPGYMLLARFLGREEVVGGRVARAKSALEGLGAVDVRELEADQEDILWQRLVDMPWVDERVPLSIRCSVLPTEVEKLISSLEEVEHWTLRHGLFADVGLGLVRSISWGDVPPGEYEERLERVTGRKSESGGAWVVEKCPPEVKRGRDVWGPLPPGLRIMRRLKLGLDPHGTLNPGRFVGGL